MNPLPTSARDIASRFVFHLTGLASELFQEAGPYDPGLRGQTDIVNHWFAELQDAMDCVAATEPADHRAMLAGQLDRFAAELRPQLDLLRRQAGEEQLRGIQHLAGRCCLLRNDVCDGHKINRPRRAVSRTPPDQQLVIVVTDLVRYTIRAREMSAASGRHMGVSGGLNVVESLDRTIASQLQQAFGNALPAAPWHEHRLRSTGDGAIVWLVSAKDALRFAIQIHEVAAESSDIERLLGEHRYRHRVGIAYGDIRSRPEFVDGLVHTAWMGIPLIDAARMETCATPGGIAIEPGAWERLEAECRSAPDPALDRPRSEFRFHEDIPGKNEERHRAWVWRPGA